jgi:hypothetical protein
MLNNQPMLEMNTVVDGPWQAAKFLTRRVLSKSRSRVETLHEARRHNIGVPPSPRHHII